MTAFEHNKQFSKKLISLKEFENNLDENSIKIIQWAKFNDFVTNEVNKLKDEYVNKIISKEIYVMSKE